MSGFIEKLAEAGHLTPEQASDAERRAAEMVKAAEKDPSLLAEAEEKLGGVFDGVGGAGRRFGSAVSSQLPGAAANLLALSLVGGAAGAATEAYKSVRESVGKAKAYKHMMDQAGDRIGGLSAKEIQQSFNTLYRVNPEYAQDPVIAAEFVRETNRSEAYPFQLLKTVQPGGHSGGGLTDYSKLLPGIKSTDVKDPEA